MEVSFDGRSLPVHYAALGFLVNGPMHGYELRRRLADGLGSLWRIALSQLYTVLHRLEDRGWAESYVEDGSSRPARTVFRATSDGARAFEAWVSAPVEHLRDMRVEFLAKVYFLRRRASASAVVELLDAQIVVLEESERALGRRDAVESDDTGFGGIVVSFRRKRVRSMLEWMVELRDRSMKTGGGE